MRAGTLLGLAALGVLSGCAAPADEWAPRAPSGAYDYGYGPPGGYAAPDAYGQRVPPVYQYGRASYYSDRLAGRRTANGERYDPSAFTAAHRSLPLGTVVDVARPDGRHVIVRINDRGPYVAGRIIDLSRQAATYLGLVGPGVGDVALRVLMVPPRRVGDRSRPEIDRSTAGID